MARRKSSDGRVLIEKRAAQVGDRCLPTGLAKRLNGCDTYAWSGIIQRFEGKGHCSGRRHAAHGTHCRASYSIVRIFGQLTKDEGGLPLTESNKSFGGGEANQGVRIFYGFPEGVDGLFRMEPS